MKVKAEKGNKTFEPIELTITFQNLEELQAFYSLMDHVLLVDFLEAHGFNAYKVRESLDSVNKEDLCMTPIFQELREKIKAC